jgi:hypothetical protein
MRGWGLERKTGRSDNPFTTKIAKVAKNIRRDRARQDLPDLCFLFLVVDNVLKYPVRDA